MHAHRDVCPTLIFQLSHIEDAISNFSFIMHLLFSSFHLGFIVTTRELNVVKSLHLNIGATSTSVSTLHHYEHQHKHRNSSQQRC